MVRCSSKGKLRSILHRMTADSTAHAEIGLTTAGGHKGCHRCTLHYRKVSLLLRQLSVQILTSLSTSYSRDELCQWTRPITERKRIARNIDAMHAIVLNLIKIELENHLLADLGPNASVVVSNRDTSEGGQKVKWTVELKDGRVPSLNPNQGGNSKLGHK